MKRKVQEQPSRPIPQIYEEVRKEALNAFDKYGQIAMMQDYPSLKKVMPNLYLERRSFVPPEPKTVGDLDLTSELFILDDTNQENIIKGDAMISNDKRVVLCSTNDLLDILARSKILLGDGTFKICPSLWTQVFIISAEVEEGAFCPCIYVLLPDKTRIAYDTMFSMVKEALSRRGISLAAEFFMSDFEHNIRESFMNYFPTVQVKGCLFHYGKAIVSKVQKRGFKSAFTNFKDNGPFCAFIRCILGLPYIPVQRMNEAIRNLYILCRKLHGKQRSFGLSMIKYVMSTWIQGSFPVITWNVFNYDGVNTNNNSEAYNSKLGAKLKPHPNVYFLFKELKSEMESSRLDAIAAQTGN